MGSDVEARPGLNCNYHNGLAEAQATADGLKT